jgi:hypothetical protein
MKTTVEIADPLFEEARRIAARDGDTLRSLIEQGLRQVVSQRKKKTGEFRLRDASVGGNGLTPEFQSATWEQIRDEIYKGRGA